MKCLTRYSPFFDDFTRIPAYLAFLQASSAPAQFDFLFRLYNGSIGDHLYTCDIGEINTAIRGGYNIEGILGRVYHVETEATVALYRLYNASSKDHFYTASTEEVDSAKSLGYAFESIVGYIYPKAVHGTLLFYRLFNGEHHFYTTSEEEANGLVNNSNWKKENSPGYILAL